MRESSMRGIIREHREDDFHNTRTTGLGIDDYSTRRYSEDKHGVMTPPRAFRKPGCVAVLTVTSTTSTNTTRSAGRRQTYHPETPLFISPRQSPIRTLDYYDLYPRTSVREDGWPTGNYDALDNAYTVLPDFADADADTVDPTSVHDNQTGLDAFEDVDTSESVEHDDRLDGLPVYLSEEELPDTHINDPSKTGPDRCDQCGGRNPWARPLERGVNGTREGGARDGDPTYDHCDPETTSVRECECCGCPACAAKGIRHRSGKPPERAWACGNPSCELDEFEHPVKRPPAIRDSHDSEHRVKLYWRCRHCGEATQAPFVGIPEDLLTGEPRGD